MFSFSSDNAGDDTGNLFALVPVTGATANAPTSSFDSAQPGASMNFTPTMCDPASLLPLVPLPSLQQESSSKNNKGDADPQVPVQTKQATQGKRHRKPKRKAVKKVVLKAKKRRRPRGLLQFQQNQSRSEQERQRQTHNHEQVRTRNNE